jgi:hypothetical protein
MTRTIESISSPNISLAWSAALASVIASRRISPISVTIAGFQGELPDENLTIRAALDEALAQNGRVSCEETAFTIFPYSTWQRLSDAPREVLFERYRRMYPRLLARDKQKYGTYFGRLIDYEGIKQGKRRVVNQLDHIISTWQRSTAKNRRMRSSALQASLFDPAKDHTGQPVRGFPCLQQVGFGYDDEDGLTVSAFYPTQYMFDRAYGNYLGLCHLGLFMAKEMGLKFVRLDTLIASPVLSGGISKKRLKALESTIEAEIAGRELRKAS